MVDGSGFHGTIRLFHSHASPLLPTKNPYRSAEDLQKTLGENVRRLRRMRGLTQGRLADLAGVSVHYVGKVEAGRANPKATTLAVLAQALGISPFELISPPGA